MFQYEFEKRPPSAGSCDSRATMTTDWSRVYPKDGRSYPSEGRSHPTDGRPHPNDSRSHPSRATTVCASVERARRPLPPRPIVETLPTKTTIPLKVWIIASASCFAVCAALVLATVVITKWGTSDTFTRHQMYELPEPVYSPPFPYSQPKSQKPSTDTVETTEADISLSSDELEKDLQIPILQKFFKNVVNNRDKVKAHETKKTDTMTLASKPQIHPMHDTSLYHPEKRIEKKDQAIYPINYPIKIEESKITKTVIPSFKLTLPEVVFDRKDIKIIGLTGPKKIDVDYEEYDYNNENLYDDYMQSNTMTSYLIEKVQELHDWIVTDPDLNENNNVTKKDNPGNEFGTLLKALNETLIEGNVTIIMSKLKDLYFGENYTHANHSRKVLLTNSTDLLSFGILTLDVMLLHNIQLMAWENQEAARAKMMKDPEVFAFNALFLEPNKVEVVQNEVTHHHENMLKRPYLRAESTDEFDIGKTLLENVLEAGMSTARAAIHLGRAYKNTKNVLNQLSNRETLNANIQNQISRNIGANTHALEHLQTSFSNSSAANTTTFTELDCVWLLYCKNLMATAKLNAPYGTMARINGMALRMLTGELSAEHALDTMLYEALTGWTDLRCVDMFPRCSKVDAAAVVMESILAPIRKSQSQAATRA
ncbi:hypothetical protein O0L34_g15836 [Tuta absoluta]|nr:hypothetical protein O0L34_g15836 [Tuta absoluta]